MNELNKRKYRTVLLGLALLLTLLLLSGAWVLHSSYNALITTPEPAAPEAEAPVSFTPEPVLPIREAEEEPSEGPTEEISFPGIYHILLLGVDSRSNTYDTRTDTMLLVSIKKKSKEILLTSFLRDTYVYIPDWGYQRLNAANVVGGPEKVMDTIHYHFGITTDDYVFVNFRSFVDIIDRMGGVDIELNDLEVDYINARTSGEYLNHVPNGVYHLNGEQALSFCRNRSIGSDLRRTEQQRRLVTALWNKTQTLSLSEMSSAAEAVLAQTVTDMDRKTFLSLVLLLPTLKDYTVEQQQIPADGTFRFSTIGGASVIEIDFDANREILKQRLSD